MKITELLKMIAETAGSTAKKAILAEQNTELLTEIFDYTYGGRKYFVKKYSVSAEGPLTIEDDWPAIKTMLDTLAAKTVTGNAALSLIDNVVSGFTKEDQEVIQHIIEGNLKCGVTLKTFEAATGTTSAATSNALPVALAINLDKVKGVNPIDGTFYASRKLDGCVSGDTLITMADGSLKTIKELVETNSHEKVLTYNTSTGKTEACKILNHLKNGEDIKEKTHQWYEIELEDGRKIKVTGNHRIYIPALNCYRRVDELKGDEEFLVDNFINISKIKNIKKIDENLDRYDIEIDKNHNYFANGILVHNCRTICKVQADGDVLFLSRSNKEFQTLDNLIMPMRALFGTQNEYDELIFDGECCIVDENGDEHFDWIMKEISRKNHTIANPCYNIFDMLTPDEYYGRVQSPNFTERLARMKSLFDKLEQPYNEIKLLKQERITSQEDFDRWSQYVEEGDWEGFMLRKDAPFKGERTKDLIKVKKFQDAEYTVVDIETGQMIYAEDGNKNFDVVTAIIIEHKGNRVGVGSGLSKEQRIDWFQHPEHILGKIVTIQYFEETTNSKDGSLSLRFPVLKAVYDNGRTF